MRILLTVFLFVTIWPLQALSDELVELDLGPGVEVCVQENGNRSCQGKVVREIAEIQLQKEGADDLSGMAVVERQVEKHLFQYLISMVKRTKDGQSKYFISVFVNVIDSMSGELVSSQLVGYATTKNMKHLSVVGLRGQLLKLGKTKTLQPKLELRPFELAEASL